MTRALPGFSFLTLYRYSGTIEMQREAIGKVVDRMNSVFRLSHSQNEQRCTLCGGIIEAGLYYYTRKVTDEKTGKRERIVKCFACDRAVFREHIEKLLSEATNEERRKALQTLLENIKKHETDDYVIEHDGVECFTEHTKAEADALAAWMTTYHGFPFEVRESLAHVQYRADEHIRTSAFQGLKIKRTRG